MSEDREQARSHTEELEVVLSAVREAGALLVAESERPNGPRAQDGQPVVDGEILAILVERLTATFPTYGLVARLQDGPRAPAEGCDRVLVVDPHDGARDFLAGQKETSIAVALVAGGQLVLGVVSSPLASEACGEQGLLAWWVQGGALHRNGSPVEPPESPSELGEDTTVLVSRQMKRMGLKQNRRLLQPADVIPCSSISTRMALVATGQAHGTLTIWNPLQPWGFAAGQALLQGAGGDLVDADGLPIRWKDGAPATYASEGYFGARNLRLATEMAARFAALTASSWMDK